MTTKRQKFLELLSFVQNSPEFAHQDIMTFAGFLDDVELASHIVSNARRMSKDRQAGLLSRMREMRDAA